MRSSPCGVEWSVDRWHVTIDTLPTVLRQLAGLEWGLVVSDNKTSDSGMYIIGDAVHMTHRAALDSQERVLIEKPLSMDIEVREDHWKVEERNKGGAYEIRGHRAHCVSPCVLFF